MSGANPTRTTQSNHLNAPPNNLRMSLVNRTSLKLLALALALLLAWLLATFERAAMPRPGRTTSSEEPARETGGPSHDRVSPAKEMPHKGVDVREDGLVATWFAPPSSPAPALLVLGGSEGGKEMSTRMASGLHAQGYGTLALAYFDAEGLPKQLKEVPLEYFSRAIDWLVRQPGIDAARIGVVGGSKGAEAALLLASRDRRVRAVVAFTPSDYAWQSVDWEGWSDTPSWTEDGSPIEYLRYAPFDPAAGLRAMYDRSVADSSTEAREAARIPLERSEAAILLIAGEADALWGAVEASDRIARSLAERGYRHEVQVLRYPDAGHVVFMGRTLSINDALMERILPMGGTPEGIVAAVNDAWPKSVNFLARHLSEPSDAQE